MGVEKKSPRVAPHHLSDPSLLEATFFSHLFTLALATSPQLGAEGFKAGSSAPA
ncbi:hypothetical protein JCM18918_4026 [Cutibacterium acnes JCM 18918]|nr:hypothetical protein JCM18918_4026 [Cutibacterium acnes JCM 18918]